MLNSILIGAIAGDIIGSVHEAEATKTKSFPLFTPGSTFTDDTVMTLAVAETLLNGSGNYRRIVQEFFRNYPDVGYGQQFMRWCLLQEKEPYNSWGNGSAMRVSPVGAYCKTMDEVLAEAERSATITHNHPEGVRGAKATAVAVFLAREGSSKGVIQQHIETHFGYQLDTPLKAVRRTFLFDVSCEGTVPWAIRAFLEGDDFEDTIRNAISLGGDADTLACIAGGIAAAHFGVPDNISVEVEARLDDRLRDVLSRFGTVLETRRTTRNQP